MLNFLCGLFTGSGGSNHQCAANVCFQAIDLNDCPICGAVYRLECSCGKFIRAMSGKNGCVTFHGVCPGTYKLYQDLAPYGYLPDSAPDGHTVTVSKDCCVRIEGRPMRCFQSINERDHTPTGRSDQPYGITTITTATDTISGRGEPGCKIKVEFPGPEKCCCCTCVRRNGTWSVDVPASETLLENEDVIITQCCPCLQPSDPLRETVVPAL